MSWLGYFANDAELGLRGVIWGEGRQPPDAKFVLGAEFDPLLWTAAGTIVVAEPTRISTQRDGATALDTSFETDLTHFAERYESSILSLDQLTRHQKQKLKECHAYHLRDIHIRAPAGAGKTFIALQLIIEKLLRADDTHVLFVAKNPALSFFVSKWLAKRASTIGVLGRFYVLYDPLEAVHSPIVQAGQIKMTEATAPDGGFGLMVVDESHHLYRSGSLRPLVERHVTSGATQRLLLSDVSQSLGRDIPFPEGMVDVRLTEIVRSSKRIVQGAMAFQLGENKTSTESHHGSSGPPLKSFLFDVVDGDDRFECYAKQTVSAIKSILTTFPGLDLHDRVALVVPDDEFKRDLGPVLSRMLPAELSGFRLSSATDASAFVLGRGARTHNQRWLVFDTMAQMDGLERLIVIAVGLDAAINDDGGDDVLETRSRLYRAVTRAHMMVSHSFLLASLSDNLVEREFEFEMFFLHGPLRYWS